MAVYTFWGSVPTRSLPARLYFQGRVRTSFLEHVLQARTFGTRSGTSMLCSSAFGRTSMLCSSDLGNLLGWHEQRGSTVSEEQLGTTTRSHEALRGD